MTAKTREERLIETLRQIAGIAGCCIVQRLPTDDKIIADHIEEISDMAEAAIKDAITAAKESAAAAPVLREALRPFVEAYEKAADPIGDSDLYNEQPRHVTVTLGDCRRAASLLGIYPKVRA